MLTQVEAAMAMAGAGSDATGLTVNMLGSIGRSGTLGHRRGL